MMHAIYFSSVAPLMGHCAFSYSLQEFCKLALRRPVGIFERLAEQ
jgi:hypothetical protein